MSQFLIDFALSSFNQLQLNYFITTILTTFSVFYFITIN